VETQEVVEVETQKVKVETQKVKVEMQGVAPEVETQRQAILNLMVMVMKVISQKVVMLLVAQQAEMAVQQQAAQIHQQINQSNRNTGYFDV
jgi:hypothetical protein